MTRPTGEDEMSDMTDERALDFIRTYLAPYAAHGEKDLVVEHIAARLRAAPQPPAEAKPCGCGEATCTVPWEPGCGLGKSEQHAEAQAQGVGEACPHCKGNPGLDCNSFGRTAPPSAPLGNSGAVSALRVLSDFNPGADEFTDALSCLWGYFDQAVQSDQMNDLSDALELPDGFRVVEHLPGIWEYQFDIEDEADEDSDRKVSRTSWNHPALAAVAAWKHSYDEAKSQPPSAPVGVEGLPEKWRREAPQAKVDSGEDAARAYREAVYWCAFQLEAALAAAEKGVGND